MINWQDDQAVAYLYQQIIKEVRKELAAAISGGVTSVNGKTGAVSLTAADVGAVGVVNNAGAHNAIYRGKNLGMSVTAEQYAAIKDGSFEDLYIGDYWTIGGATYRIAAFDYYRGTGNATLYAHSALIVPDAPLYSAEMNTTNTTDGGYAGSKMRTSGLEQAEQITNNAFPGHVLSHKLYITNAVSNGRPSGAKWVDSTVDLMNEQMVYGSAIFMPTNNGETIPNNYRSDKSQLPLFAHRPDLIVSTTTYWLRDIVSIYYFSEVSTSGMASYGAAGKSSGVRPAFCIYGG